MNLVLYIVLWATIGLFAGFIASWLSGNNAWGWFFLNLAVGFAGAIGFGYFLSDALLGMQGTLSAYSILFAIFGATLLLIGLRAFSRLRK